MAMCVCVRVCVCAHGHGWDSVEAWRDSGQENGQQDSRRQGRTETDGTGDSRRAGGQETGQRETVTDRREGDGEHGDRDSRTGGLKRTSTVIVMQ